MNVTSARELDLAYLFLEEILDSQKFNATIKEIIQNKKLNITAIIV